MIKKVSICLIFLFVSLTNIFAKETNEILFLGYSSCSECFLIQLNPKSENLTVPIEKDGFFISADAKPGMKFQIVEKVERNFKYPIWKVFYSDGTITPLMDKKLEVPSGLSIVYSYDENLIGVKGGYLVSDLKNNKDASKTMKKLIKKALKIYKGTKWEPLLQADLEVYSDEK